LGHLTNLLELIDGKKMSNNNAMEDETSPYDALRVHLDEEDSYLLPLNVDPSMYGAIIGKGGQSLKALQGRTGAVITVPNKTSASTEIKITSKQRHNVISAATQLEFVLAAHKDKAPFTHFFPLPLADSAVLDSLEKLNAQVLNDAIIPRAEKRGFDAAAQMKPQHFHLTLFMLKLMTVSDVRECANLLKSWSSKVYDLLQTRSLLVRLAGIEIMNDDPSEAHVVFAKFNEEGGEKRLDALIDWLGQELARHGYIDATQRDVKLHATIWNSR
jgi:predicted RNA-binding protein YlqC (UPF0109 family)